MALYEFQEQDAYNFANHIHAKTRLRGDELEFKVCPICKGVGKDNEYRFSINTHTGQFFCMRASCGASGNMIDLSRMFDFSLGTIADEYYKPKKTYKTYPVPKKPIEPKPAAVKYLESRGISQKIAEKYQITTKKDADNILVFPFVFSGEICMIKYRKTDYNKAKDNAKEWSEKNGKPVLFGMDQCNLTNKTLIVCEGQLDSLSVAEAGIENAVSVPNGKNAMTWVSHCWDWLKKFEKVIVFGDYEKGEISLLRNFSRLLNRSTIKHVREQDYKECKDANDILRKYGKEQIRVCIENAVPLPISQIKKLSSVKPVNVYDVEKLKTGIIEQDRLLRGGLPFGYVHIITGKAGRGKLLSNETPVFTKGGWKQHGDLAVGDMVIGRDGKFVKVTHVFEKQFANMEIQLSTGEKIKCHENHEWVVDLHSGNGYKEKILSAKELYEKKNVGYTHPLRLIVRKPLDGIDNNICVKPYTLGVWLGNGRNGNPDVCSSEKDLCVIESIIDGDGYEVSWETTHKITGVKYFGFRKLREQLQTYGMCHSRKITEKHIPHEYLTASLKTRLELLAGLIDTDGHYEKEKGEYRFATTGERLCSTFIDLIHTFGWNCWCSVRQPKVSSSGIIGRKIVYEIGFIARELRVPCRVERKRQDKVKLYKQKHITIESLRYVVPTEGNCIEVEGGIYCVGKSMIPTHNSTFASQLLIKAVEQKYPSLIYSGELTDYAVQGALHFQIAGRKNVVENKDIDGSVKRFVTRPNEEKIMAWYDPYLYLYDTSMLRDKREDILSTVEQAVKQYGIRVVLLDNLMVALNLDGQSSGDKYERQSRFVDGFASLAQRMNVMVILVAHRRKGMGTESLIDEIAGSSDIINQAGVVMSYETISPSEISKGIATAEDRKLLTIKNRALGYLNEQGFILHYDDVSRRIYGDKDDIDYVYDWNKDFEPIDETDNPFL